MDSREYRFIYPLGSNADIPADFPKAVRESRFEAGVFLPQDESSWHTGPQSPARLLLLEGQTLHIIPHPTSGQEAVEIPLGNLGQLETGYILLFGWLKFTLHDGVHELIYNTRASQPLEKFIAFVRKRWLLDEPPHTSEAPATFGDDLDVKFRNLLQFETGTDEAAVVQYFQATVKTEKKILLIRRINWLPGHLVLLTSGHRVLWITDHYKRYRELYAAINRSAPLRLLESCCLQVIDEHLYLIASFRYGNVWRIPVRGAADDASAFAQMLQERVSVYERRKPPASVAPSQTAARPSTTLNTR